ncbi:MAG: hypothetical protein ACRD0A_02450 [Acidimicrobiales bacterium]
MTPEPWVGNLAAPLLVLNLNPGIGGDPDRRWHRRRVLRQAALASMSQRPVQYPLYYLDPRLGEAPGSLWWRRCLRAVIEATTSEQTAVAVAGLEFHGYHSERYAALPVTLPSQRFVFDQLRAAIQRRAVIVVIRGLAAWSVAVPELVGYRHLWRVRNPRAASVSERNLGTTGFKEAVRAVDGSA